MVGTAGCEYADGTARDPHRTARSGGTVPDAGSGDHFAILRLVSEHADDAGAEPRRGASGRIRYAETPLAPSPKNSPASYLKAFSMQLLQARHLTVVETGELTRPGPLRELSIALLQEPVQQVHPGAGHVEHRLHGT
jgi:hypothetical protein